MIELLKWEPLNTVRKDDLCPQCLLPSLVEVEGVVMSGQAILGHLNVLICTDCNWQPKHPSDL